MPPRERSIRYHVRLSILPSTWPSMPSILPPDGRATVPQFVLPQAPYIAPFASLRRSSCLVAFPCGHLNFVFSPAHHAVPLVSRRRHASTQQFVFLQARHAAPLVERPHHAATQHLVLSPAHHAAPPRFAAASRGRPKNRFFASALRRSACPVASSLGRPNNSSFRRRPPPLLLFCGVVKRPLSNSFFRRRPPPLS